jgi:hypothetical protein
MLAFALGTQRNIRKGNAYLTWLQGGLPQLGPRATMRWIGSSAAQLEIVEPVAPFREAVVIVVLEPRDVPLLWFASRRGGRRDVVIVRASLNRAPRFDLEAAVPGSWLAATDTADSADSAGSEEWTAARFTAGIEARVSPGSDTTSADSASRAWDRIAAAGATPTRLSIRRTIPHLEVHVLPPASGRGNARLVVGAIVELAGELARV